MININVVELNEDKRITGTINGNKFNIPFTEGVLNNLQEMADKLYKLDNADDYYKLLEKAQSYVDSNSTGPIVVKLSDLNYNTEKGTYHLISENKYVSDMPIPGKLIQHIMQAHDNGLPIKPLLKLWTRFLRSPFVSTLKANLLANYLTAVIVDYEQVTKLVADGYTEMAAEQVATYQDVLVTMEGILVTKKYASLITEGYKINDKNEVVKTDLYPISKTVNSITGEVKEEIQYPSYSEDLYFEPAVMRKGGDAFYCGQTKGHVIQIGKIHKLENWNMVNTDDNSSNVKGLHVGGYNYVQSYNYLNAQLLDCFLDPMYIGAISSPRSEFSDGAIRCKEYMVYGANIGRTKGFYHSSHYAKIVDNEWEELKSEAINESNKKLAKFK